MRWLKVETPVKEPEAPNTKNKENSKTEPDKPMDIREKNKCRYTICRTRNQKSNQT